MALIVRNLCKAYGTRVALRSIDLTLSEGVIALIGPNGSGKSTLLQVLATLCRPDTGQMSFDGWEYGQHQRSLRSTIGYLPQEFEMPPALTPRRLLTYLAQLRGGDISQVLKVLHLEAFADKRFHQLSGGQIRLVGIAQALLGNPRLLLLDELNRSLDVDERESAYRVLAKSGKLTIFSTHIPEEAERIAQSVIVLHEGQVLFYGALEALRASAIGLVYELSVSTEQLPQLTTQLTVSRIILQGSYATVRSIGKPTHAGAVVVPPSLEDAYLLLCHNARQSRGRLC